MPAGNRGAPVRPRAFAVGRLAAGPSCRPNADRGRGRSSAAARNNRCDCDILTHRRGWPKLPLRTSCKGVGARSAERARLRRRRLLGLCKVQRENRLGESRRCAAVDSNQGRSILKETAENEKWADSGTRRAAVGPVSVGFGPMCELPLLESVGGSGGGGSGECESELRALGGWAGLWSRSSHWQRWD